MRGTGHHAAGIGLAAWLAIASAAAQAPEAASEAALQDQAALQEQGASAPAPSAAAETIAAKPAQQAPAAWDPRYHDLDAVSAWSRAWVATGGAEALRLPRSRGGREPVALQFGAPGPAALNARPTVFLLGGLDGVSLAGAEAAMRAADELLRQRESLPEGVAFVCVPWAAPDGLARALAGEHALGRDLLPVDDDGDLSIDEDVPDDLDADGHVLEMLLEDPEGPWTRASDARFLVPARPGDRQRYRRSPEGRDDDGDGRFNEDPAGGAVLDLSFPVGWNGEPGGLGGALPLDDELSRALADLILARPPLAVLALQGNHGLAARAGGVAASDPGTSAADEAAVRIYVEATGRIQPGPVALHDARGEERPGAAIDWVRAVAGALALEVAPWGPLQERQGSPRAGVSEARSDRSDSASTVAPLDRAWARWLDDLRGGIGFVDWHPVDLGEGTSVLVGGWLPFSRANPPPESLEGATRGFAAFARRLAQAAPRLELRVLEAARDGEVVTVRVRVENPGQLPTGLSRGSARGAELTLALPEGARLLWGESEARLGVLEAGATSREITAVALVPPGVALRLSARAPWASAVEKEIRP